MTIYRDPGEILSKPFYPIPSPPHAVRPLFLFVFIRCDALLVLRSLPFSPGSGPPDVSVATKLSEVSIATHCY